MDGEELFFCRHVPAVYPTAQGAQEFPVERNGLVIRLFQCQWQVKPTGIKKLQVMLVPMDVNICRMLGNRVMREQDTDALQPHHESIAGKLEAPLHVLFQRLGIVVAAHQYLVSRQFQDALQLCLVVKSHITQMNHHVIFVYGFPPMPDNQLAETDGTLPGPFQPQMPDMGIRYQIHHFSSPAEGIYDLIFPNLLQNAL